MTLRLLSDDVSQGGFAGAGGAVEDSRSQTVGLEQTTQQLTRTEKVLLADELIERVRPHPGGERQCG